MLLGYSKSGKVPLSEGDIAMGNLQDRLDGLMHRDLADSRSDRERQADAVAEVVHALLGRVTILEQRVRTLEDRHGVD